MGSSSKSANQDVLIFIRLLEYNNKEKALKMKRGKKVGLRISKTATAAVIREKAEEKWKAITATCIMQISPTFSFMKMDRT